MRQSSVPVEHRVLLLLLQSVFDKSNPNIVSKSSKVPCYSHFQSFIFRQTRVEQAQTIYSPARKQWRPQGGFSLQESDALLDLHRVWKERKTRSEIYQGAFTALCDKQRRPFFLHAFFHIFFFTPSEKVEQARQVKGGLFSFLWISVNSELRHCWKKIGNISFPLFNKTWTLFGDLSFHHLEAAASKKEILTISAFPENLWRNRKSKQLPLNRIRK